MAIQKEIWVAEIAANLFKDNTFLRRSRNDDAFVEGKVVHLPQSGALPAVVRDRSSFPATITERTDTEVTYNLHSFSSDPTLIRDMDEIEVSYEKRQNVLDEHIGTLTDSIATYMAYAWAPNVAANIVRTTGAARPASAPGATGNRKKLTKADILSAKILMDKMDVPQSGRYLLLNAEMLGDLLEDTTLLSRDFVQTPNLELGTIGRLLGFEVYVRSHVGRYAAGSNTPKDPDAANAATDEAFALAWHERFVRAARGEIKVFADEDVPQYYGSIFSAEVRAGGTAWYTDKRGVVAIIEDTTV